MKYLLPFSVLCLVLLSVSCANRNNSELIKIQPIEGNGQKTKKMTVEIWSDFVCPFCYIGKRKFETALEKFQFRDSIEIVWKSYQLNPGQKSDASKNAIQSLSESKGISFDEAKGMASYVTDMAKTVGLQYNFEKIPTVNTANAHRFSHLAKSLGKQNEAEELLFNAYFILGQNIDDLVVLQAIGNKIGISPEKVASVFQSTEYHDEVKKDIDDSRKIGVQGVPFFVFNNKYAVSGAQDSEVFLKSLEKAYSEFRQNQ